MSCLGDTIRQDLLLRLLRAMPAVCGNVATLALPEPCKGVMGGSREHYFPSSLCTAMSYSKMTIYI